MRKRESPYVCSTCKKNYGSKDFFNVDKDRPFGIQRHCRKCAAKKARDWLVRNRERFNKNHYKSYKNNPEKYKARSILTNAITSGKITKEPCKICGNLKVHGHHVDYSKPLEVIWLCQKHHTDIHANRIKI